MLFLNTLHDAIHVVLHLNLYLGDLINRDGMGAFGLMFLIVFCETGLIIMPFLPGDSLLFAAGSLIASTHFSIFLLMGLLILAAFLGDNTNYAVGRFGGRRLIQRYFTPTHRILNTAYLRDTEQFYEKYGVQALIIARFIPIVRTFCPFVAGVAALRYRIFAVVSLLAAGLWVGVLTYGGYRFGNLPAVKAHFSWVILGIIGLSLLPLLKPVLRRIRRI